MNASPTTSTSSCSTPDNDGIEDPDSDPNAFMRMGDYRPRTWFTTFSDRGARDPARGFRR